ncbi:MAG: hypothetical protein KME57_09000 [Scytonema hyalinum WJT4-NPBG1]|nr:hypothetical protein [Scytonema hyalinum WJT4-NPBG1]
MAEKSAAFSLKPTPSRGWSGSWHPLLGTPKIFFHNVYWIISISAFQHLGEKKLSQASRSFP